MAINKDKNINLQLTISKDTFKLLERIQKKLNDDYGLTLTKSQVITTIIKHYFKDDETESNTPAKSSQQDKNKRDDIPATSEPNYSALVVALKNKLKATYPQLDEITGIPAPTLKKWASGQQKPSGENLKKLMDSLKKYGII